MGNGRYNADSSGKKAVSHFQETVSFLLDGRGEVALGVHVGVLVQEGFSRDSDMGEFDAGVVDTVEAHLVPQIF